MKKIFIFIALFPLILGSCQQEETTTPYDDSDATARLLRFETVGDVVNRTANSTRTALETSDIDAEDVAEDPLIICEFEIGRPKRNCRGFGICEFVLFPKQYVIDGQLDNLTQYGGVVETDLNGQKYLKVLVTEEVEESVIQSLPSLKIDENLKSTDINGDEDGGYVLKKGNYSFDSSLGEHGGYKINIE